jgi:hypothetical protein
MVYSSVESTAVARSVHERLNALVDGNGEITVGAMDELEIYPTKSRRVDWYKKNTTVQPQNKVRC